jgi:tetratricopeptide (TPR) repeat protein
MEANTLYVDAKKMYEDGQAQESVALFEQARAAYLAQGDEANAVKVGNDLGVVYYLVGRRDEAKQVLQDVLAMYERRGDVAGQAKATGNLAQVQNRMGEKDAAERNYHRAAELFHQVGDKALEFDTYRALSQMELQRNHWLQAILAYDRGLAAKGGSKLLRWFFQIPLRLAGVR